VENVLRQYGAGGSFDGTRCLPALEQLRQFSQRYDAASVSVLGVDPAQPDAIAVHVGPEQGSSFPDAPTREKTKQEKISQVFRQMAQHSAEFRLLEKSLPFVSLFWQMANRGNAAEFLAGNGQLESLAQNLRSAIDRSRGSSLVLLRSDIAINRATVR